MRRLLLVLTPLCLLVWVAVFYLAINPNTTKEAPLPTLMVLPTITPSFTPSATIPPSETLIPTVTLTPSITATGLPTATPTLAVRVLAFEAVMPGVVILPTQTPLPAGLTVLPAPPEPFEPLPDATQSAPPFIGWHRFESDHPAVSYQPAWTARQVLDASQGQYHRTERGGSASFVFEGEALRIRYVAAENMGRFGLWVDGVWLDEIDAYADTLTFPVSRTYLVGSGIHRLELRTVQGVVGLDAIDVFRTAPNTLILPLVTAIPSPEPIDAARVALVSAPPTVQPTITPQPDSLLTVSVIIAYDENGNRAVDPAEGVSGIPIRLLEVGSNRVIVQATTDASGAAQIQVVANTPMRVVAPYFSKGWDVPNTRRGGDARFTLLLTPGNQPGLIP